MCRGCVSCEKVSEREDDDFSMLCRPFWNHLRGTDKKREWGKLTHKCGLKEDLSSLHVSSLETNDHLTIPESWESVLKNTIQNKAEVLVKGGYWSQKYYPVLNNINWKKKSIRAESFDVVNRTEAFGSYFVEFLFITLMLWYRAMLFEQL